MELRELAEQILFGTTLRDKLIAAPSLEDENPGVPLATPPETPARPHELSFAGSARARFPTPHELEAPHGRGLALHFFANHELLAMELMALGLLLFPDAPTSWRRGVAATLREEQTHLELYLERMADCGVELGEAPVNDFFWRHLHDMRSPLDFVTHMNLTFEQANLDFAAGYARIFREVGDEDTARVLDRVLADEIGHVRHGVVWFDRLAPPGEGRSLWTRYTSLLRDPITPSRARGTSFEREPRQRAGLPDEFIDSLEVHALAKGRPPTVYLLNLDCEAEIARGRSGHQPAGIVARMQRDLELLPLPLAAREDVVLVRRPPSREHLRRLQEAGLTLPQLIEWDGTTRGLEQSPLRHRAIAALRPWGATPTSVAKLSPLTDHCRLRLEPTAPELFAKTTGVALLAEILEDLAAAEHYGDPEEVLGRVVSSPRELRDAVTMLAGAESAPRDLLLKLPFASSGQGHARVLGGQLDEHTAQWADAAFHTQGALVIEPLLDHVADLALLLDLREGGETRRVGLVRFLTTDRGQYAGTYTGNALPSLGQEAMSFLHAGDRKPIVLERALRSVERHVGRLAGEQGYRGPAGVDLMLYRTAAGQLRLRPFVELNPRLTMATVALELRRRTGRSGLFTLLGRPTGCAGWQLPPDWLALGDPEQAEQFVAVLIPGASLANCTEALAAWQAGARSLH